MRKAVVLLVLLAACSSGTSSESEVPEEWQDMADAIEAMPECSDLVGQTMTEEIGEVGCRDGKDAYMLTRSTCGDGRYLYYSDEIVGVEGDEIAERVERTDEELQRFFATCQ